MRRVVAAEEEYLSGPFLTHLTGEICRAVSGVVRGDVGVCLFENCMLLGRQCHVTDHVEAVPAPDGPTGHDADDHLWHETDETLDFEDVETAGATRIDLVPLLVLVAIPTSDSLIASGAEGPATVFRRRPIPGQEHATDVGRLTGVVHRGVQLVNRVWPESIAHFGSVEGDAHHTGVFGAVIGDVGEVEA